MWREHLSYQSAIQVVQANKIYCATTNALFSIDGDEIQRYSKITCLSETGIRCIAWDDLTQQLVIAYTNSNIDIVKNDIVKNVGDIMRSSITGNKTINHIFCNAGIAYISMGLGIVVLDLLKYEIKDTWILGSNGNQLLVNTLIKDGNFFYAATAAGLKKGDINTNLSSYNNWQTIGDNTTVRNVVNTGGNVFVIRNDSLLQLNGSAYSFIYNNPGSQIRSVSTSQNKILLGIKNATTAASLIQLSSSGVVEKTYIGVNISNPKSALIDNGNNVWIADSTNGLSKNVNELFVPNGPPSAADGQMVFANNTLYVAAGSINENWNYQLSKNGVYNFSNDIWTHKNYYNTPLFDSVFDFICLAQQDTTVFAGSYGGGLVAFTPNTTQLFKKNNSTLQGTIGDDYMVRISGLTVDKNNHLWISNFGAANTLHVKKFNGAFKAYSIPYTLNENAVGQLLTDDNNNIWIVSPQGNGLICFNYGSNIESTADDQWKYYRKGLSQGNLPSNQVVCIAKDANNIIWIGTDNGIAIIPCTNDAFSNTCSAIIPITQSGYLFNGLRINCIAVDAANRKWVATKNGVWLLNADGNKVIQKFTQENSPLLSSEVKQVAIDPQSGEVFFATSKGICSYRGTATDAAFNNSNVLVFPNPVPPNFTGTIAIKNLPVNSLVKITELNGRLVYQTRSLGGQAVWNGLNYKNEPIAPGVYLVLVKDENGDEKLATKIAVIK